jgi:hypothetical protein
MATIDTAATVAQRVQELLEDRTVRDDLGRARRSSRDAYKRAKRKKHKADAARDPLIRHRVKEVVRAGREVVEIAREGPARLRRRRRRRRALALLLVAGGAAAIATARRNPT